MTVPYQGDIWWEWDQGLGAFVITPGSLPEMEGSGFPDNTTVEIYLVVAPTSSILVATLTSNSLGCFYADLTDINTGRDPIQVAPALDLDQIKGNEVLRACCFEGVVDGEGIATLPIVLIGNLIEVLPANTELHQAQTAVVACMADAGVGQFAADPPLWDGTSGKVTVGGYDAANYLSHTFKASYDFDIHGNLVSANLTPAPGNTAWIGIKWDTGTLSWVPA